MPTLPFGGAFLVPARLIHVHDGRSACLGPLLAGRWHASLVRTQHFVRPASAVRTGIAGRASIIAHRLLDRRLDGYIAVSEAARSAAIEREAIPHVPIVVIPPGVRVPSEEQISAAQAQRLRGSGPTVASAGRLEPERRFDVLIHAIPTVRSVFPTCTFKIIGSGSAEVSLRQLANQLNVADAITWTGWLPDIVPQLACSDIYVNTLPYEGFGMATAEAMACGLPVVVTSTGASAELIDGGRAGMQVGAADPEQLATAICTLLGNSDRAKDLGTRARQVAQRYSIENTAAATLALYCDLLSETGCP